MHAGDRFPLSSSPSLRASALQMGYPGGPVLTCPDFAWSTGLYLVQGDEGCGKTTLLRTLAGELQPRGGALHRSVHDVYWQNPRQELGVAEREATVRDVVGKIATRYPQFDHEEFAHHAAAFDLDDHLHKPLLALSTGSLRKVWMAAGFASGAALTLIDEPFAALDNPSIRYLRQVLGEWSASAQAEDGDGLARCLVVAHWDTMQGVTWDGVLTWA